MDYNKDDGTCKRVSDCNSLSMVYDLYMLHRDFSRHELLENNIISCNRTHSKRRLVVCCKDGEVQSKSIVLPTGKACVTPKSDTSSYSSLSGVCSGKILLESFSFLRNFYFLFEIYEQRFEDKGKVVLLIGCPFLSVQRDSLAINQKSQTEKQIFPDVADCPSILKEFLEKQKLKKGYEAYLNETIHESQRNCERINQFICCPQDSQHELETPIAVTSEMTTVALNPPECGKTRVLEVPNRIVGGSDALVGAWPWLALYGKGSSVRPTFTCGGSIISKRHVMTAAHCVLDGTSKYVLFWVNNCTDHKILQTVLSFDLAYTTFQRMTRTPSTSVWQDQYPMKTMTTGTSTVTLQF